jgi:hypothetical protein
MSRQQEKRRKMMIPTKRTNIYLLLMPVIMMGIFFILGMTAFANGGLDFTTDTVDRIDTDDGLAIESAWLDGDMLNFTVRDSHTGKTETFDLDLTTYAKPGDEYISIRASSEDGRMSDSFRFRNPYYTGHVTPVDDTLPLTPDGTASVIDNATEEDGKEFFTFATPEGNVFYLIIDRQRDDGNVYLLNAVTEYDLELLAVGGDGRNVSAIPDVGVTEQQEAHNTAGETVDDTIQVETNTEGNISDDSKLNEAVPAKPKNDTGMIIFLVIALAIGGGVGYYLKIVKPRQDGNAYDDDYGYDDDDVDDDIDHVDIDGDDDIDDDGREDL